MRIADVEVGTIGLGTAPLAFGDRSFEEAVAVVVAAIDAGVLLIDTALAYSRPGVESYGESVVAQALRSSRAKPTVATKGGHWRDNGTFPVDGSAAALRTHLEISLRTLGVDTIDLYQLHHVDPAVPLEESVAALAAFRQEGKIRSIGLSNVTIPQLESARGLAQIDAVQNRLSLSTPADRPTARHCAELGIAYLAYMPLHDLARLAERPAVAEVASRRSASPARVLLAWLLQQGGSVLPLVGSTRRETIIDSVAAADLSLDEGELSALDGEASAGDGAEHAAKS